MAVIWTTLLSATGVIGFDLLGTEPLSYLGTRPRSAGLFTLGLAVSAVLLTAFHQYVRGRFASSSGFSAAMLTGLAGQVVAAFVPIGGDRAAHQVHTFSALVLGASLPVLMWRFAAGQPAGRWRQVSYALFWAEMAACAAGLWLSARVVAPLAEILPGTVFHLWVVTVTLRRQPGWSSEAHRRPVVAVPASTFLGRGRRGGGVLWLRNPCRSARFWPATAPRRSARG